MLELESTDEGTLLRIRVRPGSVCDRLVGEHAGRLKLAVAAPPERGKANQAVLKLLAKVLKLPKSRLRIVAGRTSPDKSVLVSGLTRTELLDRLKAVIPIR